MNKKFVCTLFGILIFIQSIVVAYGHPLDVSNTTLTLYTTSVVGVTYIHPVELDRILVMSGGMAPTAITIESYYSLTGVLSRYLSDTLQLINKEDPCVMGSFVFEEGLMIDEVYSMGFPISYTFTCTAKVENPLVRITFLNEVPLQTNRLYIYQSYSGEIQRTEYKVLNAKKDSHVLSLKIGERASVMDTDGDSLSDEDEILYGTKPNNQDTDGDGYDDAVEIQNSWNPISAELSPGQVAYSGMQVTIGEDTSSVVVSPKHGTNLAQDASVWGGERFRTVLRDIRLYVEGTTEGSRLWILLVSIGTLGFLHAIGPGHSKGVLISQIIDNGMSYSKSIAYCGIFTCIHILDIIVVVVITKLFFNIIDPSVYLSLISRMSAILVVCIGLYLSFIFIKKYLQFHSGGIEESGSKFQKKNYIIMAIITGLTPCAFGWSIFLMLLAIGKMSLAIPLLLSLGLGIFICLALIATITWFMKDRIYSMAPKISRISPILSSLFILFIGTSLVITNF